MKNLSALSYHCPESFTTTDLFKILQLKTAYAGHRHIRRRKAPWRHRDPFSRIPAFLIGSTPATTIRATTHPRIRFEIDFDSSAQEPGKTIEIALPKSGFYLVFCGIHPEMELNVDVTR